MTGPAASIDPKEVAYYDSMADLWWNCSGPFWPLHRLDVMFNMEVVEHVAELETFMSSCCALVQPGGLMFVATLHRTWRSFVAAIVGAEYVLRWLPRRTYSWHRFRGPDELTRLLAAAGLATIDRMGVRVNPLTRSFTLTSDLSVNYMLAARRESEGSDFP